MNTDLTELKDLVAAIKADHQAQKDKEKRDAWTKYVSLSMICIAVLAAIASQQGGGYSSATIKQLNEATFNQALASDQWTLFQAKGIKEVVAQEEQDLRAAPAPASAPATVAKTPDALAAKLAKYEADKTDASTKATAFEQKRDEARQLAAQAAERSRDMGRATSLFQIAIAFGGMCLVVKKRWLWLLSLVTGAFAASQMAMVLFKS